MSVDAWWPVVLNALWPIAMIAICVEHLDDGVVYAPGPPCDDEGFSWAAAAVYRPAQGMGADEPRPIPSDRV
jgi:hypothetical protein